MTRKSLKDNFIPRMRMLHIGFIINSWKWGMVRLMLGLVLMLLVGEGFKICMKLVLSCALFHWF